jgi:hypothetical protein
VDRTPPTTDRSSGGQANGPSPAACSSAAAAAQPAPGGGNGSARRAKRRTAAELLRADLAGKVDEVLAHYRTLHPRARPGATDRKLVQDRLTAEGWSVDDLKQAIDGNHKSDFHCGSNDNGREYHSLGLIMRDARHVQDFIETCTKAKEPKKKQEVTGFV